MEETKVGQLVIDLRIKIEALEKGLESAKKKLQEIESQNKQVENSNSSLDASFIAMSAGIVASLAKIKSAIDDGVSKYNTYTNSMQALQKTAKATNTSMTQIKNAMKDVNEFKFIDDADLSKSMQNLLRYGFTVEQASEMLKVMQDAAVGNREPQYELSEAIKVTTDGIRMENSQLSNAVGVEKNIAKMYEDEAKKLGKKADALTQAEKVQAVYNGFMAEAGDFIGSAAEMANSYQGQQAQLNATNIELSRTIGESMIPALTQYSSLQLSLTKGLTEFIKNNKIASSGVITLTTGLLATVAVFTTVKTALLAYTKATGVANTITKTFTTSLMANPLFWGGLAITAGITALNVFATKVQESIDKMNEATEKSKTLSEALNNWNTDMSYTESEKSTVEQAKDEAQQIIDTYENKKNKIKEIENKIKEIKKSDKYEFQKNGEINALVAQLNDAKKSLKSFEKEKLSGGKSIENYKNKVNILNKTLDANDAKQKYLTNTNIKAHRENLINIAQTKADIDGKRQLLNVLKQGKTSTDAYTNAKSQLVKVYPELANVNTNTIASTEEIINAEERAAQAEWALAQASIMSSIAELAAMQNNDALVQNIAIATKQKVDDVRASIEATTNSLMNLSKMTMGDFKGSVTTNFTPKVSKSSGGSKSKKSYENKALDNYKKQIEHKKSLDQISLQQEISMYQIALKKYAKTQDEKWELTEKMYSLQKEVLEKSLNDYTSNIEHKKTLDQISLKQEIEMYQIALKRYAKTQEERKELTEKIYELQKELQEESLNNYMTNIEHKKSLDKLSLEDEINMYQYAYNNLAKTTEQKRELEEKLYDLRKELAKKNKELLDQKITDYKRYVEDQKNIRGAEYDAKEQERDLNKIILLHKNYLNQIIKDERLSLEERKDIYQEELQTIRDYEQQKRDLRVQSVDNTVSQLTNAITKQLEEMQETDKKAIEENIELVEKWKETRIKAINEEYEARIEAIQKELDLLDKSEENKTRAEEDAEYQRKKNRLEQLIAYEHDATTKVNYQKELDKLVADYQKTLDKRALQDKKDALKEQQDLLKEEQDNKVQAIEDEADRQKEQYNKQLDELEKYYNKQKELAQQIAEKMLLNVEKNQKQILNLLKTYGNAYEITGQSLGEKLAQGINKGVANKIQNIIQKIQDTIDAGIENKIKQWTSGIYQYEAGKNKPQTTKTVNVTQNNYIEQNPEMPSEAQRKLKNISEKLATEIAGM